MTNRKRGQLDELCMDHDPGASPASDPDDLEDVGKRLERCAGKGRSGSKLYIVVYPIVDVLTWPDFHMGYISIDTVVSMWYGEGIWNSYKILTAAVVTAVCAAIRRKVKPQ